MDDIRREEIYSELGVMDYEVDQTRPKSIETQASRLNEIYKECELIMPSLEETYEFQRAQPLQLKLVSCLTRTLEKSH
ncbi:hypothetical protein QJS10_CPB11g00290 [Acorus calamus]|uniref:Uncharacterized protein n=1 Tax=Acorus calamus TaxID=4465 RepID=A0AAV9DUP7_ACOCL|nr:hypothetical protein QJS10_CPB11g00290 [Acorus calamus]